MTYLARYAHLKEETVWEVGEEIESGDVVGIMGNTGFSTGAHLHFDLIQVSTFDFDPPKVYRLADIPNYIIDLPELMKQYNYFIDDELFGCPFKITSSFGDPNYDLPKWKFHPAFDLIPREDKGRFIYWNRSFSGTVHDVGHDKGYGNYIIIRFER